MRVLATADLHGKLPAIPDCDLLLIAGDICPDFNPFGARHDRGEARQELWLKTYFRRWLWALNERGIEVVGIAGNHDFVFQHPRMIPKNLPWHYLRDESVTINDLTIYGTPWVPHVSQWAFYGRAVALEARADLIPGDTDVLLTHSPPYEVCDFTCERFGHDNVGDRSLNGAIERSKPRAVVCGHIHEAHGRGECSGVPVYNVSLVDENYDPVNPVVEISLESP